MPDDVVVPSWMREPITAEQYAAWSTDQRAGFEVVDGLVQVVPSATKRHNRLARVLANALDVAGGAGWNADLGVEVWLRDAPLTVRRPDVVVYAASSIDADQTLPAQVLLVVEVVSPGSQITDLVAKADQYARAGIEFYWRVEQPETGVPVLHTHRLDLISGCYRDGVVCVGVVEVGSPFVVRADLGA